MHVWWHLHVSRLHQTLIRAFAIAARTNTFIRRYYTHTRVSERKVKAIERERYRLMFRATKYPCLCDAIDR